MQATPPEARTTPDDSGRSALEFVHRLLIASNEDQPNLFDLLGELAAAFAAPVAGWAMLPEGVPLSIHPTPVGQSPAEVSLPWREQPDLIEQALRARTSLTVRREDGGSYLLTVLGTPERDGWLLWLEDAERGEWSEGEASALLLAGQFLTRRLADDEALPRWAKQLDRSVRQQRLEAAARLVRRLAHDFGNVLTGILGFSELSLAQQISPHSPLHAYLTEVYRAAQNGAQYTNQLRLFARRQSAANRSAGLATVLAEEEKRLRPVLGAAVRLDIDIPPDLPAAAIDTEQLRHLLGIALDNAREAIAGPGVITVSVRPIQVSAGEARDLFGDVQPGGYLEITVADTGGGLTPDIHRQLFAEPFFTTKPRKKGFRPGHRLRHPVGPSRRTRFASGDRRRRPPPHPRAGRISRLRVADCGSRIGGECAIGAGENPRRGRRSDDSALRDDDTDAGRLPCADGRQRRGRPAQLPRRRQPVPAGALRCAYAGGQRHRPGPASAGAGRQRARAVHERPGSRRVHATRVRPATIRAVAQAFPPRRIGPRGPDGARPRVTFPRRRDKDQLNQPARFR